MGRGKHLGEEKKLDGTLESRTSKPLREEKCMGHPKLRPSKEKKQHRREGWVELSVSDIFIATAVAPTLFHLVLHGRSIVTFTRCLAQLCFLGSLGIFECLLLSGMSYDRYVAICKPLHYSMIMNYKKCTIFVISSWIYSFSTITVEVMSINTLYFCGPNSIDHFFCDFEPILQLSCSDTFVLRLLPSFLGSPVITFSFLGVILSYFHILKTIFRIPSLTGRKKAFSTCSSHITVVSIYFGTLIFIYVLPNQGRSGAWNKLFHILCTVVLPVFNPVIYCLRNKDIKGAFWKLFGIQIKQTWIFRLFLLHNKHLKS
ncbi:olfactory receptor 5P55-like [Gastrophryne carolinensis]